jgi:hypothetical protein
MTETVAQVPFTVTDGLARRARYAELARTGPVHRIVLPTGEPAWLITGYPEVRRALNDPRLIKSETVTANFGRDLLPPEVFAATRRTILGFAGWSPARSPGAGSSNWRHGSSRSPTSCSTPWIPQRRPI